MKFTDFEYKRPDYPELEKQFSDLIDRLAKADNRDAFMEVYREIETLSSHISTMSTLCRVRHSINTADEFYSAENDFWDEHWPLINVYANRIDRIMFECPFRAELYEDIPEVYFQLIECSLKSFDEKIVPLLQQENRLSTEYGRLKASARIEFRGEIYNLSTIAPFTESLDEETRKEACAAATKFYSDNEAEFDRIYDEMVKVRTEIAHQLGFESYTQLGYLRMNRIDYTPEMVANYRRQILEDLVPVASQLYQKQAERLNRPTVAYYNENMEFVSGNPTPKGTYDELIEAARKMYHEMSPETGEFIDTMIDGELWDLKSKPDKEMGGYCTSIPDYRVPFIFANFNGTSGDVDVLTHEAGHAFQYYMSRNIPVVNLQWPTMESAEIHSMSMEFNAWPWMKLFFKEDEPKYKYLHLGSAVKFLPYGVLIDHFQHEVYDHPEYTPDERKRAFRKLEKMYLPHKDYSEAPLLEKGCWWFRQGHVFQSPFYYIDYTLAQICALQFWARNQRHDPDSWKDYLHLCSLGGTLPFTALVKEAGLISPFADGCVKSVIKEVAEYLDNTDDKAL